MPKRSKKRRRKKMPKPAAEMTGREVMEHCLGKRVANKLDSIVAELNQTTTSSKRPNH